MTILTQTQDTSNLTFDLPEATQQVAAQINPLIGGEISTSNETRSFIDYAGVTNYQPDDLKEFKPAPKNYYMENLAKMQQSGDNSKLHILTGVNVVSDATNELLDSDIIDSEEPGFNPISRKNEFVGYDDERKVELLKAKSNIAVDFLLKKYTAQDNAMSNMFKSWDGSAIGIGGFLTDPTSYYVPTGLTKLYRLGKISKASYLASQAGISAGAQEAYYQAARPRTAEESALNIGLGIAGIGILQTGIDAVKSAKQAAVSKSLDNIANPDIIHNGVELDVRDPEITLPKEYDETAKSVGAAASPQSPLEMSIKPEDTELKYIPLVKLFSLGGKTDTGLNMLLSQSPKGRLFAHNLFDHSYAYKGDQAYNTIDTRVANDISEIHYDITDFTKKQYLDYVNSTENPLTKSQFMEEVTKAFFSNETKIIERDIPGELIDDIPELGYTIKSEPDDLTNIENIRNEYSKVSTDQKLQRYTKDYVISEQNDYDINNFLDNQTKDLVAYGPPGTGKTSLYVEWMKKNPNSSVEILDSMGVSKESMDNIISNLELNNSSKILFVIDEADKFKKSQFEQLNRLRSDSRVTFLYTTNKDPKKLNQYFKNFSTIKIGDELTPEQKYAYGITVANRFDVNKSLEEIKAITDNPEIQSFRDIKRMISEGYSNKIEPFLLQYDADTTQGFTNKLAKGLNDFAENKLSKNVMIFNETSFAHDPNLSKKLNEIINIEDPTYWKKNAASLFNTTGQVRRIQIADNTDAEFLSRIKGLIEQSNDKSTPLNLIIEDPYNLIKDEAIFSRAHIVDDISFFNETAARPRKASTTSITREKVNHPISQVQAMADNYVKHFNGIRTKIQELSPYQRLKFNIDGDMLSHEFFQTTAIKHDPFMFDSTIAKKLEERWNEQALDPMFDIDTEILDKLDAVSATVKGITTIKEAAEFFAQELRNSLINNKGQISSIHGVQNPLSISDFGDFLIPNIDEVMRRFTNKNVPRYHAIKTFGSADPQIILNPVRNEYADMIKANPGKEKELLEEWRTYEKSGIQILEKLLNKQKTYGTVNKNIKRLAKVTRTSMLQDVITVAGPDTAMLAQVAGIKGFLDGWKAIGNALVFQNLAKKYPQKDIQITMDLFEDIIHNHDSSIVSVINKHNTSKVDSAIDMWAYFTGKITMLSTAANNVSYEGALKIRSQIFDAGKKLANGGKLDTSEIKRFKADGLDKNSIALIYRAYEEHGITRIDDWPDYTKELYLNAVRRRGNKLRNKTSISQVNEYMDSPLGELTTMFTQWAFNFWRNQVMPAIQEPDAKYLLSFGLVGAMAYTVEQYKAWKNGQELSDEQALYKVAESLLPLPFIIGDKTIGLINGFKPEELLGLRKAKQLASSEQYVGEAMKRITPTTNTIINAGHAFKPLLGGEMDSKFVDGWNSLNGVTKSFYLRDISNMFLNEMGSSLNIKNYKTKPVLGEK